MSLLQVRCPASWKEERAYAVAEVLRWLGVGADVTLESRDTTLISVPGLEGDLEVAEGFFELNERTADDDWSGHPLQHVSWREPEWPIPLFGDWHHVPILFARNEGQPEILARQDSHWRLNLDVFGIVFFMLSRWEEAIDLRRDRYGRYLGRWSFAYRNGFLEFPAADAAVEVLRVAIASHWPGLPLAAHPYRVVISHDVDHPYAYQARSPVGLVRSLGADLIRRHDPLLSVRRLASYTRLFSRLRDPLDTFDFLTSVDSQLGIESRYFFIARRRWPQLDGFYDIHDPIIVQLAQKLTNRGFPVGLHISYGAARAGTSAAIRDEVAALRMAIGREEDTGHARYHLLSWEANRSWSAEAAAGITDDYSLCYPDVPGFRCGTSLEFRTFDLRTRRRLSLIEHPLHVMDGTLFSYLRLSNEAAYDRVAGIARTVRNSGGTLHLLWHNSTMPSRWQQQLYADVAAEVSR